MVRHAGRNRASSPTVSSFRPPRFTGTSPPSSQQTPPSAQRPPPSQQQQPSTPTVIPSSIPSQQQSQSELPYDVDPIEDFSEHEAQATATPKTANGSQTAFQVLASSQTSSGSQRFGGFGQPPKWSAAEDAVLMRGIREGWSATQIARELSTRRTGSAIRGRKKALKEKFNLLEPTSTGPRQLQVESRRRWTPAEMSIIYQGVRDELGPVALQQKLKDRTLKSIEHKIKKRKLLSKDPVKSGDRPPAKKAKVDKSNVGKAKVQTPLVFTAERAQDETALDDTVQDEAGQETPTLLDQTVVVDVEEYPAYPDSPQQREEIITTQEPDQPVTTQADRVEVTSISMKDDFDFSKVQTAFVKLPAPAEAGAKTGRLRKPTAAAKKTTPRRAMTRQAWANADGDVHDAFVKDQATAESRQTPRRGPVASSQRPIRGATREVHQDVHDASAEVEGGFYDSDFDNVETSDTKPRVQREGQVKAGFYDSESDGVETSQAKPRVQRKGLFDDWTPDQRWKYCLRQAGGDEQAARRHLKEANLTAGMYDAMLRKDKGAIESIRAERRQLELRDAIAEGRARRKRPAPGAATIVGAEEADEEVLREEDWEIFIEKDDVWSLPSEDHDSDEEMDDEDDGVSGDMIRDREFVEVEDEDEEDLVQAREIEELVDDEDEEEVIQYEVPASPTFAIPPPPRHCTPIQAMQANVVDDAIGLATPAPTTEKLRAFGIDSKQPTSSVPTTAASTTAGSERSDSKRSRRRSRNATRRRESGNVRPARKDARFGRSMLSEGNGTVLPAHRASSQALFSDETDNPFMNIVRNAHIPSPPKRTQAPARRRDSPSPPAWFAGNQESDDESEEESESE